MSLKTTQYYKLSCKTGTLGFFQNFQWFHWPSWNKMAACTLCYSQGKWNPMRNELKMQFSCNFDVFWRESNTNKRRFCFLVLSVIWCFTVRKVVLVQRASVEVKGQESPFVFIMDTHSYLLPKRLGFVLCFKWSTNHKSFQ